MLMMSLQQIEPAILTKISSLLKLKAVYWTIIRKIRIALRRYKGVRQYRDGDAVLMIQMILRWQISDLTKLFTLNQ